MNHLVTRFAFLFVIVFSMFATGCPDKSIQKAKSSSARVATFANAGVNLTRDLYRQQIISITVKDRIADAFITLAKAGQTFDAAVLKVEAQYGPAAPPRAEIDKLFAVFDSEVVDGLVDILKTVTASGIPDKFREIVETLKSAVIVIAKVFNRAVVVEARLAEVS